jgi:hypothetical protein
MFFSKRFTSKISKKRFFFICKIGNGWNLPSPFSRNTLIQSSEKTSWNLKKLSNKFKNDHENFLPPKSSLNLMVLAYRRKKSEYHEVMTIFEFIGQF